MTLNIAPGWWLLPLAITIASLWWCSKQNYRGDYNMTALFTFPATGLVICGAWMIYFGIGWAAS